MRPVTMIAVAALALAAAAPAYAEEFKSGDIVLFEDVIACRTEDLLYELADTLEVDWGKGIQLFFRRLLENPIRLPNGDFQGDCDMGDVVVLIDTKLHNYKLNSPEPTHAVSYRVVGPASPFNFFFILVRENTGKKILEPPSKPTLGIRA